MYFLSYFNFVQFQMVIQIWFLPLLASRKVLVWNGTKQTPENCKNDPMTMKESANHCWDSGHKSGLSQAHRNIWLSDHPELCCFPVIFYMYGNILIYSYICIYVYSLITGIGLYSVFVTWLFFFHLTFY